MNPQTPWLGHYDPGVAPTLAPYPRRTLLDYVSESAARDPRHPAILFKGSTITYGALERLSDACAAAFTTLGIRRGDRIALVLPNCPQFLIAELGAWKIGAIVAPLNPLYAEAELEAALRESGAIAIVGLTRFYARIKHVQARTSVRHVIATNIKDYFPPVLKLLFTLFREKHDGDRVTLDKGDEHLSTLLARHSGAGPARATITPDDPAVLLMSGGTTGRRRPPSALIARTHTPASRSRTGTPQCSTVRTTCASCRCRCFTSMPTSAFRRWRSSTAARWRS